MSQEEGDDTVVEVEPENADAVRLFLRLGTQWAFAPRSITTRGGATVQYLVRTGLKYEVLPTVAQFLGIAPSPAALDGLRVLEAECMQIYDRRTDASLARYR